MTEQPVIGLFKTELIKPGGPWRIAGQVELATPKYIELVQPQAAPPGLQSIPSDSGESLARAVWRSIPAKRDSEGPSVQTLAGRQVRTKERSHGAAHPDRPRSPRR